MLNYQINIYNKELKKHYFKSAVAFFFFLHGISIGNGQQGISYNVKVLCVCGGLVAPTVGTAQKPNRITAVDLSTSAAITQNTCYAQCFFVELIKLKL